jgi:hypothetical protein
MDQKLETLWSIDQRCQSLSAIRHAYIALEKLPVYFLNVLRDIPEMSLQYYGKKFTVGYRLLMVDSVYGASWPFPFYAFKAVNGKRYARNVNLTLLGNRRRVIIKC